MSAWMTTDVHRSAIVQQMIVSEVIAPKIADDVWKRMTFTNHYALHCRYGDPLPYDNWQEVELNRDFIEAPLHLPTIWKNISCWQYQCAEFPDWNEDYAVRLSRELSRKIEREVLGYDLVDDTDPMYEKGYDALSNTADERARGGHCWGIDSWDDVIDHRRMALAQHPSTTI